MDFNTFSTLYPDSSVRNNTNLNSNKNNMTRMNSDNGIVIPIPEPMPTPIPVPTPTPIPVPTPFPANTPIAMAYVPCQVWETPYEVETGFDNGTLFPSLNLPFERGAGK